MKPLLDLALLPAKILIVLIKFVGLVFYIPWRTHYFLKRWRYGLTVTQVEWVAHIMNTLVRQHTGHNFVSCDGFLGRWFWWYVANSLLKYAYRDLKNNKHISEVDSSGALKLYTYLVPIIGDYGKSIRATMREFRLEDYADFQRRPIEWFNECRGNVFQPEFVFYVETLMRFATPDSIRALEASFAYAKDHLIKKITAAPAKKFLENTLDILDNLIGIAKDAPLLFCDCMLRYADYFAQAARDFGELASANLAIEAWQHMNQVRYRVAHHLYTDNCNAELHAYLDDMRRVGAVLYNRLNGVPQLPAPTPVLPPTEKEAALMTENARLNEKIVELQKRNASRDCSKCFLNSVKVAVMESVKEGIDASLVGKMNTDGEEEITQTEAARQLGVDRVTVGRWIKFCETKGADGTQCPVPNFSPLLLKSKTAFERWKPNYIQYKAVNASKRKKTEPQSYSAAEKQDHDDIEDMFSSFSRGM